MRMKRLKILLLQAMVQGDSSDVSWIITHRQTEPIYFLTTIIHLAVLLYPSKMLYPVILPLVSMFDAFFKDAAAAQRKLKLFWVAFIWLVVHKSQRLTSTLYNKHVDLFDTLNLFLYDSIFFWEIFPEWIFPLLTGISIFCLANPRSADFTRIFGGSGGNEGLGFLSICLDWQYISGSIYYQVLTNIDIYCFVTHLYYDYFSVANPMAIPLKAQFSNCIGCVLSL